MNKLGNSRKKTGQTVIDRDADGRQQRATVGINCTQCRRLASRPQFGQFPMRCSILEVVGTDFSLPRTCLQYSTPEQQSPIFYQKTSMLVSRKTVSSFHLSGMEMNVGHIAGPINIVADGLSRWDGNSSPPQHFCASDRVRISLSDLWLQSRTRQKFPSDAYLLWRLPRSES